MVQAGGLILPAAGLYSAGTHDEPHGRYTRTGSMRAALAVSADGSELASLPLGRPGVLVVDL